MTEDLRYLEEKIAGLRELIHERFNQIESRFEGMDKAVQLQAREYERRLEALNGEGARLALAVSSNVSADTWSGFIDRFNEWQNTVNNTLALGASSESLQVGRRAGVSSTFAVIVSIVTVAMPIIALVIYLTVR